MFSLSIEKPTRSPLCQAMMLHLWPRGQVTPVVSDGLLYHEARDDCVGSNGHLQPGDPPAGTRDGGNSWDSGRLVPKVQPAPISFVFLGGFAEGLAWFHQKEGKSPWEPPKGLAAWSHCTHIIRCFTQDSPLVRAAQLGRALVLDEADKAPLEARSSRSRGFNEFIWLLFEKRNILYNHI